jgi:membrane protease YdiL (CAAX protease family)
MHTISADDTRTPARSRSAGTCRTADSPRTVVWNRPGPSSTKRQFAALAWEDVRGVVSRAPLRDAGRRVDVPVAVATWVAAFIVGQLVTALIVGGDDPDTIAIPTLFVAVAATWLAYLGGMWAASQRAGSGDFVEDYQLRFAPIDLVGVPIGVLCQLVLVPLLYLPLSELWPDTFSDDRLSENAEKLVDRADGASMVLLVLMVCLLAPVVEELVYRGLLQGSLAARFDQLLALLVAAAWFTLIHFRPVEYPGLFLFGLVAGAGLMVTGRLGLPIVTHVSFNITGLLLALP